MKRAAIENFAGIGNRLEVLVLARLLQEAYGGEILLDWPELDAFEVPFARRGKLSWLQRLRSRRVRRCDEAEFAALRNERWLLLRSLVGPESRMRENYLQIAGELRLRHDLLRVIEQVFAPVGSRPLVGVHVRRGDFVGDPAHYTTRNSGPSPCLPLDWLAAALRRCCEFWPNCAFFLASSGPTGELAPLRRDFDFVQLPLRNPYALSDQGHLAEGHPVADLFALACCEVIIATPLSSFSHFAANALGPATICMVPPQEMHAPETPLCRLSLRGQPLAAWTRAFRGHEKFDALAAGIAREFPCPRAHTDWISAFGG